MFNRFSILFSILFLLAPLLPVQAAYYFGPVAAGVAETARYVDTASAAGGDGTTSATSGANRAFHSWADALDSLPATLTTPYVIYLVGTAADTTPVTQTHWDFETSVANYIRCVGDNTSGKWDSTKHRLEVSNDSGLYNSQPGHVYLENIQIKVTTTTSAGTAYNCFRLSTLNNLNHPVDHRYINCIGWATNSGTDIANVWSDSDSAGSGTVVRVNCIAIGGATGFLNGDDSDFIANNLYNFNCTAYGNQYNFQNRQKAINCLSASPAVFGFIGTGSVGHEYNADTSTDAVGLYSRNGVTVTFVDAPNLDLHLAATDAGARNFGKSDAGSGVYSYSADIDGATRTGAWDVGADQASDGSLEQEGFRFRDDDGSETTASWLAAQDTSVTRATATTTRLRILVNATGNPPTQQYQLGYKKSTDSVWKKVEVGGAGAITYGAAGTVTSTGTTAPTVAYPSGITAGDILIMSVANRPNASTVTTPTGWTLGTTVTGGAGAEGAGTGTIRTTVFYKEATGFETGSETLTITSGTSVGAVINRISRTTGKDWALVFASGADSSAGTSYSATMSSDPGVASGDLIFCASGTSEDTGAMSSESISQTGITYNAHTERTDQAVSTGNDLRLTTSSHTITSGTSSAAPVYTMTSSSANTAGATVFVRLRQSDQAFQLATSANIAASGAATTVQLTAPSGKATSDFVAGRIQDDENPADTIDITTDDYSEFEWSIKATSTAVSAEVFQFRATISGAALDTYTVTPQWTIP